MAAALERSVEKIVHNGGGLFVADESSWHYQYVGVVVLACKGGYFRLPTKCGTDALVFVQCHADAFSASADGYAGIADAFFHSLCKRVGIVGIVAACCMFRNPYMQCPFPEDRS